MRYPASEKLEIIRLVEQSYLPIGRTPPDWQNCRLLSSLRGMTEDGQSRSTVADEWGFLDDCRYLLHDRDTKYTQSFRRIIGSGGVEPLRLPPRSPNLNAYAERWVKSVKDECLSKLIFFGEASLRHALRNYLAHYHGERNHQGKDNVVLFPPLTADSHTDGGPVACRERLGGLLKFYYQEAA